MDMIAVKAKMYLCVKGKDMTVHCHILLAEDDAIQVELAEHIFRIAGWTFRVVRNGNEAVTAAKQEKFDLLLMDFHLPGMTGAEATILIRGWEKTMQKKHVPIIGLTASAMAHEIKECHSSGMDEIITKPYNIDILLKFLERVCKASTKGAEAEALDSSQ